MMPILSKYLLLFPNLIFFHTLFAQDFNILIQDGLNLEKAKNEKAALSKFIEAQKIKPVDLMVLTKCSELYNRIGAREKDEKIRDQYYNASLAFAKMAYKYFPASDDASVSMSIALGRIALCKSGKEKVSAVKEIKAYAEKAILLNPGNFKAWHVIGKWNYEVSDLGFFEKAAIKIVFGGLPVASFSKAIIAYEKVKELNPYFGLNYLELARAYIKNDNMDKAKSTLRFVATMPDYTEDDPGVKIQAADLLKTLN